MVNHRLISTALLALSATAAAPAAADALTPVDPKVAFSANRIDSPSLTTLPDGRALVGWTNGTNSGDTAFAAVRPAGDVLGPPQVIGNGYSHEDVRFTGGDHQPLAYYNDGLSSEPRLLRLEGSTFAGPGPFFTINAPGRFPSLARCDDGGLVVAYQTGRAGEYRVVSKYLNPAGVSNVTYSTGPTPDPFMKPIASCPGNVPFVGHAYDDPDDAGPETGRVRLLQLGTSGGYAINRTLADGARGSSPVARVAPDGRAWATWSESAGTTYSAKVATRAAGGTAFDAPVDLGANTDSGVMSFTPDGRGHLLVYQYTPGSDTIATAHRSVAPGAAALDPASTPVGTPSEDAPRLLEGHPDGRPRLLIRRDDRQVLRGLPQAGTTEPETDILRGLDFGAAAWMPSGDLLTVGVRRGAAGEPHELVEGGLDTGAPPVFGAVRVPSRVVLGEAVELAADATDALGVADVRWIVGGTTLSGAKVSHAFATPGLQAVTVRATDRAGNVTETTRTVAVIDPNPPVVTPAPGTTPVPGAARPVPVLDTRAPKVSGSAKRGRRGTGARRVKVRVRVTETSAVDMEVRGRLRGSRRGTLILASKRLQQVRGARTRTTTVTVPARLLRLTRGSLKLRMIATDAAGNRRVRTMTVKRTAR